MKTILCALFLFFSFGALAQYPFQKYPAIKYAKAHFKTSYLEKDSIHIGKAKYADYSFIVRDYTQRNTGDQSCKLFVFYKKRQVLVTEIEPYILYDDYPVKAADINGDGLIDFKITIPNGSGSGLASSRIWRIYLFNKGHNKFQKISFGDFYSDEMDEYDMNGDGNYEIIGQNYVSYMWHAYWAFDLYNYKINKLINVSSLYNYPIMVKAFQAKESHQITNKISRLKMKNFSLKHPDFYEQDK